jgi:NAD+ synthase (glutamine-hydrolysing)
MVNGFFRVAAIAPSVNVADVEANCRHIIDSARQLAEQGAELIVTPEMSLTAYTCGDLFHQSTLLDAVVDGLAAIARATSDIDAVIAVGAPLRADSTLYNCAVVMQRGHVLAVIPKTYIPNYNEFYEKRWFSSARDCQSETIDLGVLGSAPFGSDIIIEVGGVKLAFEICEDLWTAIPPSSRAALAGAEVIANLSASDDCIGKRDYLRQLITQQSAASICGYVYAGAGFGESSTDLVFDGKCFIAEKGVIIDESTPWQTSAAVAINDIDIEAIRRDRLHNISFGDCAADYAAIYRTVKANAAPAQSQRKLLRHISPTPFIPSTTADIDHRCNEIVNIQAMGLCRRLAATHCTHMVVGISGGLDSTLALLVVCRSFDTLGLDRKGIVGVTMPGFGTTGRTYANALTLMKSLGITIREIPIADAVMQHFHDIGHDPKVTDVTYENSQARERTQLLMDIANQVGGMVLGTGDLSELALGWATYNGDHMSMYGVNAGVPKTLVKYLVNYFASRSDDDTTKQCLFDIIDTPISPELTPADDNGDIAQKTEDLVGPYTLHDFFLYYLLRYGFSPARVYYLATEAFADTYSRETILHWMKIFYRRFFNQQFKRSCLPDGPKVGSVCLSPRGDWRMPSDAASALWLAQVEQL